MSTPPRNNGAAGGRQVYARPPGAARRSSHGLFEPLGHDVPTDHVVRRRDMLRTAVLGFEMIIPAIAA